MIKNKFERVVIINPKTTNFTVEKKYFLNVNNQKLSFIRIFYDKDKHFDLSIADYNNTFLVIIANSQTFAVGITPDKNDEIFYNICAISDIQLKET